MKDEEYIEMRIGENRKKVEKESYKLQLSDFIPIVGMINRLERCSQEDYDNKTSYRLINAGLALYNLVVIPGAVVASGLVELLSKN